MVHSRLRMLDDPESLRGFVRNVRYGVFLSTADGEILDANPAFLRLLGAPSLEALEGRRLDEYLADPVTRRQALDDFGEPGMAREAEVEILSASGAPKTALETAYLFRDAETGELLTHGIWIDITDRKRLERLLTELSLRDPLTGCWNRRFLAERASLLEGKTDAAWGCVLLDVDHFKDYNDEHGHAAGDAVLQKLSRFLLRRTRAEERVIRLGGDEFLLLLEGANATTTERIADRLRLAAPNEDIAPFSLGFAAREAHEVLDATIARADGRLLAVKAAERAPRRRVRESS